MGRRLVCPVFSWSWWVCSSGIASLEGVSFPVLECGVNEVRLCVFWCGPRGGLRRPQKEYVSTLLAESLDVLLRKKASPT